MDNGDTHGEDTEQQEMLDVPSDDATTHSINSTGLHVSMVPLAKLDS